MTLAFPAYHETTLRHPTRVMSEHIERILRELRWTVIEADTHCERWIASAPWSLWSWGETVVLRRLHKDCLLARSQCALWTQCFDWGKNRRNVDALVARLLEKSDSPGATRFGG